MSLFAACVARCIIYVVCPCFCKLEFRSVVQCDVWLSRSLLWHNEFREESLGLDYGLGVIPLTHEKLFVQQAIEGLISYFFRHQNKKACEELLATFCIPLLLDLVLDDEIVSVGHEGLIVTGLVHQFLAG